MFLQIGLHQTILSEQLQFVLVHSELILETNDDGSVKINRINYELAVLQALRDGLRCKEIWVAGANRYRNPEED
ncbi:MAG: hypothetical protein RLZZ574_1248, partial [Cyanobacteriota bacterium]